MQYYTKEEARRILDETPLGMFGADSPNADAFSAAVEAADGLPTRWAVAQGFLLGLATGIRMERAHRRTGASIREMLTKPNLSARADAENAAAADTAHGTKQEYLHTNAKAPVPVIVPHERGKSQACARKFPNLIAEKHATGYADWCLADHTDRPEAYIRALLDGKVWPSVSDVQGLTRLFNCTSEYLFAPELSQLSPDDADDRGMVAWLSDRAGTIALDYKLYQPALTETQQHDIERTVARVRSLAGTFFMGHAVPFAEEREAEWWVRASESLLNHARKRMENGGIA